MGESQGPEIPSQPKSLLERLREHSNGSVDSTLRRLVANGELSDYDDEIANRVHDAIALCADVRELLAERSKDEDKDAGRSDGPESVTFELTKTTGLITTKGRRFDEGRIAVYPHQQLVVRLDRGSIGFFRRQQR